MTFFVLFVSFVRFVSSRQPVQPCSRDHLADSAFNVGVTLVGGIAAGWLGVAAARALVDDAISAGSSVRATVAALTEAGASVAVIGTFLVLGEVAVRHFGERGVPVVALVRQELSLWTAACLLCATERPKISAAGRKQIADAARKRWGGVAEETGEGLVSGRVLQDSGDGPAAERADPALDPQHGFHC